MYQYPYGNAQQLNLDWILSKLKEILENPSGIGIGLEEIANALISATYAVQDYNRSDIVFYEGKLYRANQNITAEPWNPAHWDEILLGDTVANLVKYISSLNNSQVFNSSNVAGTHTSDALNNLAAEIEGNKSKLNILVVGNSFDQDIFAYLPPVLIEAMPEYELNFCVLYESGADFAKHNQMFIDNEPYTWANVWNDGDTAWNRIHYQDNDAMTLKTALAYKPWDMVFTQATTSDVQTDALIESNVITNGRKMMRAIQANAIAPFNFYYIEWIGRGDTDTEINSNYNEIHNSLYKTINEIGFSDYVPVGTAIQNARTNSVLKAAGEGVSMLYTDNVHIQAGLGALTCTYVLADFILKKCGKPNGINASSFYPSTVKAEEIHAKPINGLVGMTHGITPAGNLTVLNLRAAMEIASLTINNPQHITDCSNIREQVPN